MSKALASYGIPEYLLHSQTYSVVITDLEGRYVFVNELFRKRFGFITDDFIGQSFSISVYPEDRTACLRAVEECLANPDKVVRVDLRKPDTSQEDFYWTSWEFSLLKDEHQQPVGIFCLGHDITATERASRNAKRFYEKIQTIIEEITDGFYQLDRDWRFTRVNKVAEQILGISRKELIGKRLWDLFPDDPAYNYPEQFRKAMQQGLTVTFEDYRPDLNRWFSAVVYPSIDGLTVFFKDITREKQQIEQIKQQEYMLRAIYESTTEASTFIDKDLIIRYNNHVAREITQQVFGKAAEVGECSLDYVLPQYKAEFEAYYRRVLKGESITFDRTDGTRWWQFSFLPVYNEQHQIIGIAHNVQDITERKLREEQLAESKLQLQKTIEAIPHPLVIVDENVVIRYVNEEFEKVFGYTHQEVLGRTVDFLIPERYRAEHAQLHKKYMQQGGKSIRMGKYLSALIKDGREIIVEASLNTFTSGNQRFAIVILQDVTEQKQYQDIILHQNKVLQEIAWQQSHDLRRPVANILGLCDLLTNYPNETEEMRREYIKLLGVTAKELDAVIHRIVEATYTFEFSK